MFSSLRYDINSIKKRDPAARNALEILLLYSGLHVLFWYRIGHFFYKCHLFFLARFFSQFGRLLTGIEIHPGAQIGKGLFIDHGSGVVIGETTVIGDDCIIYQGATLGGTGSDTGKRHPTLGNNVMVGSGARILGPFQVGDNSRIAANAVVLNEVPPNSTAVGVPARIVKKDGVRVCDMDQIHIQDPISLELCRLRNKINSLEEELKKVKGEKQNEDL